MEKGATTAEEKGSEEPFFIKPIAYEELIEANSRAEPEQRSNIEQAGMDSRSRAILAEEVKYLKAWRAASGARRETSDSEVKNTLAGLALSGGGIRSATFALGVTQAMAAHDKLRRFDYLSTVSGGGYLGASITYLMRNRTGAPREDAETFPYPVDSPAQQQKRRSTPRQDAQLIHLRHHGKYLTPGRGIDAISLIAVLLRGFMLNVLVWLPLVSFLLLVLLRVPPVGEVAPALAFIDTDDGYGYGWIALVAIFFAAVFAVLSVIYSFVTFLTGGDAAWRYEARRTFEQRIRYPLWIVAIATPIALMPVVYASAEDWIRSAGLGSILAGLASAAATYSRGRSQGNGGGLMAAVATIGAALTLYGILILAYAWAYSFHGCTSFAGALPWPLEGSRCAAIWWTWIGLLVLALASGYFVNVNLISVHRFYRDRLMEAFLPDEPRADGTRYVFDTKASNADVARLHHCNDVTRPTGPYHLLNANVILVNSKERSRRVRGGDSFLLSPLLCGSNATGWCRTPDFLGGDLTLATAMAISGAAANPHAGGGLFRNRPVALLMALANVRLGYWVSHPDPNKKWKKRRTHFGTALREVSGQLDESRRLLQLSDGGHFENLGVYELIRRRARLIVACDGTADPEFGFSDFITLLSRIEADFGARITFNKNAGLEVFMPRTAAGFPRNTELADRGFTVGNIVYSDGSDGNLVYVTTTLFSGLSLHVLGYRAANRDFPDQTTADQFFDEAQFEAYRHLGYTVGEAMLNDWACAAILEKRLA